jgi:O-antigen/teichoic acid export membrane protein
MAVTVIFLNKWLINLIGIDGAALATLIVMVVYSAIKIFYIQAKFNIQPFSIQTIKISIIVLVVFGVFYFWNLPFNPILNMLLKGILITALYVLLINKFKISREINDLFFKFSKK